MRRDLTVGRLRELLAELPGDLPVLLPAYDHSYRTAEASEVTAYYNAKSQVWSEDPGYPCTDLGIQVRAFAVY